MNTPKTVKIGETILQVPDDLGGYTARGSGRLSAFVGGAYAALYGKAKSSCPYESKRGSGSFRLAWMAGFDKLTEAQALKAAKAVAS